MSKPRVLILDIETSPFLVHVFGLKDQNIALNQIVRDRYIMCYTAKWLGQKRMFYRDTRTGNDAKILKDLRKLLNQTDILVTQNGARFDAPIIEARMRIRRMPPLHPYIHADTYLGNKKFGFTSHKLEYLTDNLNDTHKKSSHSDYPGMALWTACLNNDPKAWKAMKKYNGLDVLSTEELYVNTLPWVNNRFPGPVVPVEKAPQCIYCSSYRVRSLGVRKTKKTSYRRYICNQCGKCHSGTAYAR